MEKAFVRSNFLLKIFIFESAVDEGFYYSFLAVAIFLCTIFVLVIFGFGSFVDLRARSWIGRCLRFVGCVMCMEMLLEAKRGSRRFDKVLDKKRFPFIVEFISVQIFNYVVKVWSKTRNETVLEG